MILCRILGPVSVEVDGVVVDLGGAVARRLLAALATGMGAAVGHSVLADLVWGDESPRDATKSVRVAVHRLRTALGPRGAAWIVSAPGGYRLAVGPAGTDHGLFTERVTAGLQALAAGDAAAAIGSLESALALWRGRPWPEFDEMAAVSAARARLLELYEVGFEELQAARLECGDATAAVVALSATITEAPYRERRWELLALALYRSGRQAQALAELRRVRDLLVDELGIEPGPALRELADRMLAHDPRLMIVPDSGPAELSRGAGQPYAPRASSAAPTRPMTAASRSARSVRAAGRAGSGGTAPVSRLERPLSTFIGRRAELDLLHELRTANRLVTVVGPAGVGKTRLVIEYAAERPDTWPVPLADSRSAADIAPSIAAALGIPSVIGDPMTTLRNALRDQPGLLILDNCEHLVDDLPAIVRDLLAHTAGVHILTTSRRPLGIAGERVIPLHPLTIDASDGRAGPAVELLYERVSAGRADWRATPDDEWAAHAICRALDGLPLAIELAAARERVLGLSGIATLLPERTDVLAPTPHGSLSPHDSLTSAIAWSVEQLDTADRALLLRLWPFGGGFTWQAAESVWRDGDGAVLARLSTLVDRSVVIADVTNGSARYRMLETIRRYCRDNDPDPAASQQAHAQWVRRLMREQAGLLSRSHSADAAEVLATEIGNIRIGFQHDLAHHPREALRSAGALAAVSMTVGTLREATRGIQAALTACSDAALIDRVEATIALSTAELHAGNHTAALRSAESAIELLDGTNPEHELLLLRACSSRCNALIQLNEVAAFRLAHERFRVATESPNAPESMRVNAKLGAAMLQLYDGQIDSAVQNILACRETVTEYGNLRARGRIETVLAWTLLGQVSPDPASVREALGYLTSAITIFERQPHGAEMLVCLDAGVCALICLGRKDIAQRLHAAVLAHAARIGTDPCRYLRSIGQQLASRKVDGLADAHPPGPAPSWSAMVELFTSTVADLVKP
ncbi:putative ATPase [Nocardia tenerifensis]|uniref:Putative ATPase n=1 Tax=Nocardia tenerifensis TaxID=228006 RepID=A0A318JRT6_9NOCA|nr:BTAD domain-containing putative transcriptional regulator [Nocardia tenerifensis]PXX58695.1 putative ATPase [Nocardia tenerifensis]